METARQLVGRQVLRNFGKHGIHKGTITSFDDDGELTFRVEYEDGDFEDLAEAVPPICATAVPNRLPFVLQLCLPLPFVNVQHRPCASVPLVIYGSRVLALYPLPFITMLWTGDYVLKPCVNTTLFLNALWSSFIRALSGEGLITYRYFPPTLPTTTFMS
jgi:hypothetical protein